jgi:hypothetical protein
MTMLMKCNCIDTGYHATTSPVANCGPAGTENKPSKNTHKVTKYGLRITPSLGCYTQPTGKSLKWMSEWGGGQPSPSPQRCQQSAARPVS